MNIHRSPKNSCFEKFRNIFRKETRSGTPLSCCFFRIAQRLILRHELRQE